MELLAKQLKCDTKDVQRYSQDTLIQTALQLDSTAALLAVVPNPTIEFVRRWFPRILLENALEIAQFLTENITVFKSDAFHHCELSMLADISVHVLDWFLTVWFWERKEILELAIATTKVAVFSYLHQKYQLKKDEFWNDTRFKILWSYRSEKLRCYILDTFCAKEIVQFKDIQNRLSASHCFVSSRWDPEVLRVAIFERQIDVLGLMIHYFRPPDEDILTLVVEAARMGETGVLDYLSTLVTIPTDVLERICRLAVGLSRLSTLEWLNSKTSLDVSGVLDTEDKLPVSVQRWHSDRQYESNIRTRFSLSKEPFKEQALAIQYKILSEALQQEDFELANWCFHTGSIESGTELLPVYNEAAFANMLSVMNWIHYHFSALLTKATATVHLRLFYEGAPTPEVLEWLHQQFTLCLEDFSEENGLAIQQLVLHDQLESLLWVHNHFTLTDEVMQQHYSRALRLALCNENTHKANMTIAMNLVELFHFPKEDVMRVFPLLLCQEDSLEVRQWVVKTFDIKQSDITSNLFLLKNMSNQTRDWLVDTFHFQAYQLFDLYPQVRLWLEGRFQMDTAYYQLVALRPQMDTDDEVMKAIANPTQHIKTRYVIELLFEKAVTSGMTELVALLRQPLEIMCENVDDYLKIVRDIVSWAAYYGQLDCIQFLLQDSAVEPDMAEIFRQAVFGSKIPVLDWIRQEDRYQPSPENVQTLLESSGVSDVVKSWLSEHYSLSPLREKCLSLANQFTMEPEKLVMFVKAVRNSKTLLEINLLEKYLESTLKK